MQLTETNAPFICCHATPPPPEISPHSARPSPGPRIGVDVVGQTYQLLCHIP